MKKRIKDENITCHSVLWINDDKKRSNLITLITSNRTFTFLSPITLPFHFDHLRFHWSFLFFIFDSLIFSFWSIVNFIALILLLFTCTVYSAVPTPPSSNFKCYSLSRRIHVITCHVYSSCFVAAIKQSIH